MSTLDAEDSMYFVLCMHQLSLCRQINQTESGLVDVKFYEPSCDRTGQTKTSLLRYRETTSVLKFRV